MIPAKTIERIGGTTWRAICERGAETHGYYAITGQHLNELSALANRLNWKLDDGNETRDWENLINLIVDEAKRNKIP